MEGRWSGLYDKHLCKRLHTWLEISAGFPMLRPPAIFSFIPLPYGLGLKRSLDVNIWGRHGYINAELPNNSVHKLTVNTVHANEYTSIALVFLNTAGSHCGESSSRALNTQPDGTGQLLLQKTLSKQLFIPTSLRQGLPSSAINTLALENIRSEFRKLQLKLLRNVPEQCSHGPHPLCEYIPQCSQFVLPGQ
jgi:hypothetical protein